MMTAKSKIN